MKKSLCHDCNLDGKCYCQDNNMVRDCGMEAVIADNEIYRERIKTGTLTKENWNV